MQSATVQAGRLDAVPLSARIVPVPASAVPMLGSLGSYDDDYGAMNAGERR